MYFINDLFFVRYVEEDDYEKFDCVRKILMDDLRDLDSNKLKNMLGMLVDLCFSFRTNKFSRIVYKVKLLREDIFLLLKEK